MNIFSVHILPDRFCRAPVRNGITGLYSIDGRSCFSSFVNCSGSSTDPPNQLAEDAHLIGISKLQIRKCFQDMRRTLVVKGLTRPKKYMFAVIRLSLQKSTDPKLFFRENIQNL